MTINEKHQISRLHISPCLKDIPCVEVNSIVIAYNFFIFFNRRLMYSFEFPLHLLFVGFEVYLVGGCVRDLILNRIPKDFDILTSAELKEVILDCSSMWY